MRKNNYLEKVLEHMVNGEKELADELLRNHLIETAKTIYAQISEESNFEDDDEDFEFDDELEFNDDDDFEFDDELEFNDDADFEYDDIINSLRDEVSSDEYFSEDEDEDLDASVDDLEVSMDLDDEDLDDEDLDDEDLDDEDLDDEIVDNEEVEQTFNDVESAIEELRAAFSDMMDSENHESEDEEEVSDEDEDEEDADEEEVEESAELRKVGSVRNSDTASNRRSPLGMVNRDKDSHGKPVSNFGGNEKGRKTVDVKKMNVTGPQENKGKMSRKVSAPSNLNVKSNSPLSKMK